MRDSEDYFSKIKADWPLRNLLGLKWCIQSAYSAVGAITAPESNAAFATPNRWFLSGILRFGFVDYYLEEGCRNGLLKGITPVWLKLTDGSGGMAALELRGTHTSLIAHHLAKSDDPPRDSKLRFEKRLMNQVSPMLPTLDEVPTSSDRQVNLTLVHGDKNAEFSFLRAYDNPTDLTSYVSVFDNIMGLQEQSARLVVEAEEIAEPKVEIKLPSQDQANRHSG